MAKFSEEIIETFICDFVKILDEYEGEYYSKYDWHVCYIDDDYVFKYADKEASLEDAYIYVFHKDDDYTGGVGRKSEKGNVTEFTGDDEVIAYLSCEGDLYEDLYEFEAYGAHPKVEGLLDKLRACAKNYGMYWDWANGALKFYDVEEV